MDLANIQWTWPTNLVLRKWDTW